MPNRGVLSLLPSTFQRTEPVFHISSDDMSKMPFKSSDTDICKRSIAAPGEQDSSRNRRAVE